MSRRKIAPTLRWWFEKKPVGPTPLLREVKACRAELRALLAVAKWARVKHHDLRVPDSECPLCRALARLEKTGGTK